MSEILSIERMSYGESAISHLADGKTVFVDGGVPGDVVEVRIFEDKERYARGTIEKIIEPSRYRVSDIPEDAIASGALWANIDYGLQLEAKTSNVRNALIRVGHMDSDRVDAMMNDIVVSDREWGYRNKIELNAFSDEKGRFSLGSFDRESERIVGIDRAPLADHLIEDAPRSLRGVIRYIQGNTDLGIHRVGIRASERTGSIEVALWTTPGAFPRNFAAHAIKDSLDAASVVRVISEPNKSRRVKKLEILDGCGYWSEEMSVDIPHRIEQEDREPTSLRYEISAPSFFQVNTPQAERLVGLALKELEVEQAEMIADLYAGAGTFTFPMVMMGADVTAIELSGFSSSDFDRNAKINRLDADMICDDARIALPKIKGLDAVVVDPPRAGLDKQVIAQFGKMRLKKLVYISCDPQTLARDARSLQDIGLEPVSITPVDMFPQTYHIETVSTFVRKE